MAIFAVIVKKVVKTELEVCFMGIFREVVYYAGSAVGYTANFAFWLLSTGAKGKGNNAASEAFSKVHKGIKEYLERRAFAHRYGRT